MSVRLLTLSEVARELGVSRSWLYANVARLERENGFPPAVPGMGTRRLSTALERWLQANQPPELRDPQPKSVAAPDYHDIEAWRAVLDFRAEEIVQEELPARRRR